MCNGILQNAISGRHPHPNNTRIHGGNLIAHKLSNAERARVYMQFTCQRKVHVAPKVHWIGMHHIIYSGGAALRYHRIKVRERKCTRAFCARMHVWMRTRWYVKGMYSMYVGKYVLYDKRIMCTLQKYTIIEIEIKRGRRKRSAGNCVEGGTTSMFVTLFVVNGCRVCSRWCCVCF